MFRQKEQSLWHLTLNYNHRLVVYANRGFALMLPFFFLITAFSMQLKHQELLWLFGLQVVFSLVIFGLSFTKQLRRTTSEVKSIPMIVFYSLLVVYLITCLVTYRFPNLGFIRMSVFVLSFMGYLASLYL